MSFLIIVFKIGKVSRKTPGRRIIHICCGECVKTKFSRPLMYIFGNIFIKLCRAQPIQLYGGGGSLLDITIFTDWAVFMIYHFFIPSLFSVFNQSVPAYLLTALLLAQKKNRCAVLLLGLSLICCPLPFIGILPLTVYIVIRNAQSCPEVQTALRDIFSFENILGGGAAGLLTYAFFKGNTSGHNLDLVMNSFPNLEVFLSILSLFLILEIGFYYAVLFPYNKRNPLYYISLGTLCLCPMIQVGYNIDFCLRASIPSQVIMLLLMLELFRRAAAERDWAPLILSSVLVIIGAFTPLQMMTRIALAKSADFVGPSYVMSDEDLMFKNEWSSNFRGELSGSAFGRYLLR